MQKMSGQMMRTSGRMMMSNIDTQNKFVDLFFLQRLNQKKMLNKGMYDMFKQADDCKNLPIDVPQLASYHIQQLMSEIGEVLDADKRWKNFRNEKYDKNNKAEELADCFIVLMNICMFSGLSGEDMEKAIVNKIQKVGDRIDKA